VGSLGLGRTATWGPEALLAVTVGFPTFARFPFMVLEQ